MNILETYVGTIMGGEDECAAFIIDTVSSPFILHNITNSGEQYTLSFWLRSDARGSVYACGGTFDATTEWVRHATTYTAESVDLQLRFSAAGTYYIYHPQLEIGNMVTDYAPAPEDMAKVEDLDAVNQDIAYATESVADLNVKAEGIFASVTERVTISEGAIGDINGSITTLKKEVSARMTSESVELQIKKAMEDGSEKVVTSTGYTFDEDGMTIEKSGSEMKTQITEDGMTVYQNDESVLTANNHGVDARNLHATTYLVVGGRSRFENYGSNRTGCFWIGED